LSLRPARPADAATLARIHREARAAALPGLFEPHAEDAVAAWIAGTLLRRHTVVVAVDAADVPLGYAAWGEQGGRAMLLHLYICVRAQRRGVGTRLLDAAKAASGGELHLFTFRRNAVARGFYRRHGFVELAAGGGSDNEEREPDLLLRWQRDAP
jgi:ribosomal protein S18 acetylase RimI-like enzyme